MANKLAKLADLKALLDKTGSGDDALLTELLVKATSLAETAPLTGRPLMRVEGIVELPHSFIGCSRFCPLTRFPIESVTSVKQLYTHGTDADFEAADALTENVDYAVDAETGKLERFNSVWYLTRRYLQVIYTAGYIDPDDADLPGAPASAIQPPASLQQGILEQAAMWFNVGAKIGLKNVGGGEKQGSTAIVMPEAVPNLVAACQSLRRYGV